MFVDRQVHLGLGNFDNYLDLLFYYIKLKSYVVVELKSGDFDPGFISKLNMYLNIVNDSLCQADDNPTIGLLLVKKIGESEVYRKKIFIYAYVFNLPFV